jgi:hypothetical protein
MTMVEPGALGELIGAFAVVVTLIYQAEIQLKGNTSPDSLGPMDRYRYRAIATYGPSRHSANHYSAAKAAIS